MDDQLKDAPGDKLEGGGAQAPGKQMLVSSSTQRLEDHITVDQFSQLMDTFHSQGKHRKSQGTIKLTTESFRTALSHTLNKPVGDERITLLCNKIDTEGEGCIQEDEFCSYLLQQLREKDSLSHNYLLPFQDSPKFRHNMASKETLCRLIYAGPQPRYISISKDGGIGIWSSTLQFQRGFVVEGVLDAVAPQRTKKTNLWVTDCAVLQDCNKLVLSTTSRELLFYDTSTTVFKCQYDLHDLPSVPLCVTYHNSSGSQGGPFTSSYLLFGDVLGSIHILTFLCPRVGLFLGSSLEEQTTPQLVAYSHLSEHAQLVSVQCMTQVHPDWVRRISYIWHNHSFISCSNSPTNSLVMKDIGRKRKSYVFKIRKGVLCYDYCHRLEVLVTGSIDHEVRIWNPYVPTKPMAVLTDHSTAVLDVVIASDIGLVFSYSHDSVLCAWDIYEHVLVQKITIKFPFSQRLPDYGPSVLNLLTSTHLHSITVLCNEYIAELKLGASLVNVEGTGITSHSHPLCAAIYNPHFQQVVSACEGGVVTVWDVDSGHQVLRFTDCHGKQEITALSLDATGRRLLTGSRAGDIKVWNYMNRVCLKHMVGSSYYEVTGVMHILDRGKFLSVGWDKRITTFLDEPDIFDVKPDKCWQGVESHHRDDILCVSYCSPYYLATGSFDGEIKVWNLDTEKVVSQFRSMRKLKPTTLYKVPRKASLKSYSSLSKSHRSSIASSRNSFSSRPASRRLSTYRIRSSSVYTQRVPVDQLKFLKSRVRGHQKGSATLVSSEGGVARFWDIFGCPVPLGYFSMTEFEDESVMAMTTDPQDHYLLMGDTAGVIAVFDIRNYSISTYNNKGMQDNPLPAISRWQAHVGEILSIEYISHETQPLILSASGDCTVRLWTLNGHYIGVFGQKEAWNLKNPSTFQHPNTPWGEPQRPVSHLSDILDEVTTNTHLKNSNTAAPPNQKSISASPKSHAQIPIIQEEKVITGGGANTTYRLVDLSTRSLQRSSASSTGKTSTLVPSLVDKSLGCNYDNGIHKRMVGRHDRRVQYAGIDVKATQRFGSLCSPFQALRILNVEEVNVPKEVVSVLNQTES